MLNFTTIKTMVLKIIKRAKRVKSVRYIVTTKENNKYIIDITEPINSFDRYGDVIAQFKCTCADNNAVIMDCLITYTTDISSVLHKCDSKIYEYELDKIFL